MADVGDRIAAARSKDAPPRRGTVVDRVGEMLVVDWDDGTRTTFYPAPGAVWVEPGTDAGSPV